MQQAEAGGGGHEGGLCQLCTALTVAETHAFSPLKFHAD